MIPQDPIATGNLKSTNGNAVKKKSVLREWTESIIIAFILAMVIRTFVVQAFKIPTGSMRPTLLEGDIILVNKFIYGARIPFINFRLPAFREPKTGDVIVFIYPEDPKKDFIKRLNKYVILMIISSLFGMPWFYLRFLD